MGTPAMRRSRAILSMLMVISFLLPLTASAAPAEVWHYTVVTTDPPNPGSGWGTVTQLLTGSGCNGTRCGSNWQPHNGEYEVLLEKVSDRVYRGHGVGDGTPPYNARVVFRRQTCPTDGAWAAGIWHHNFLARSRLEQTNSEVIEHGGQIHSSITLTQRWSSSYYQSFAHNDPCFADDPFPQPTSTPPGAAPTPTPPSPPPGLVRISVNVVVTGTPPVAGSASGTGGGAYAPGDTIRATADYPSAWDDSPTWGGITYSGCGQSGADWQVTFAAPTDDCTITFTIRFSDSEGIPPVLPPPGPCDVDTNPRFPVWTPEGLSSGDPAAPPAASPMRQPTDTTFVFTLPGGPDYADPGDAGNKWSEAGWKMYHEETGVWFTKYDWEMRGVNLHATRWDGGSMPDPHGFPGRALQAPVQTTITLTGPLLPGHYRVYSKTVNSHCVSNARWFFFQVDGAVWPSLPPPTARLFGWVRSPHDGPSSPYRSTRDNADPARFAWTYGGIVLFYPDVALELPAELSAQGYRVERQVTGWRFRGSPPLSPTADRPFAAEAPIPIVWSKYPPAELHAPQVYAYRIPAVQDVAIAVTVTFTYVIISPANVVIGAPVEGSIDGQFTVGLVATQVLDGGPR